MGLVVPNGRGEFRDAGAVRGHCLHNGWCPVVAAHGQGLQGANLTFHSLSAFAVALVDNKNVGNFHDAGFDALHIIAHAGDQNYNRNICESHDVHFILPNAYGFDHDQVSTGSAQDGRDIGGSPRQAA